MARLPTLSQIKAAHEAAGGFFFSRRTMAFFGDKMSSFRVVRADDGSVELERVKPMMTRMGRNMGGVGKRYSVSADFTSIQGGV